MSSVADDRSFAADPEPLTPSRPSPRALGNETTGSDDAARSWAGVDVHQLADVRERMLSLAHRLLWDRHAAEDVVQDALVAAQQTGAPLRDGTKWWPWLCRIVVHRCRLHQRRSARQAEMVPSAPGVEPDAVAFPAVGESGAGSTGDAARDEACELVRRMLPLLPERQQEVLVLRHLQEMSYEQIADVLGMSVSTARVQAMNARDALLQLVLRAKPGFGAPS